MKDSGYRCRHAFESVTIHGNGEVVCSIIDGRGDFVLGSVHEQSLSEIFAGPRYQELRSLVLSTQDSYCRAIAKNCPLKTIPVDGSELSQHPDIHYLAIEPTSACDLACLSCPVRDFSPDISWRDAWKDGGFSFFLWDSTRRMKQHLADTIRNHFRFSPNVQNLKKSQALLLRGRVSSTRNGTLSLETVKRVIDEAGPNLIRIDFFNYGEPFLYKHLLDSLRHIRKVCPETQIAISTNGLQVREDVEDQIVNEELIDWLLYSVDGVDAESYARYRIGGTFQRAFTNLCRMATKARDSRIRIIWQYVVFRWNDSDEQLCRAIQLATEHQLTLWFDFAGSTWGMSKRNADEIRYLTPYLKPFTALPGEQRQEGW